MSRATIIICLLVVNAYSHGRTVQVGGCLGKIVNFSTIQAAVDASAAGDTVKVCPGTYAEAVTIGTPLTLAGVRSGNADRATLQGVFTSATVSVLGQGKYAAGITPAQGNHDTVYPQILVQNTSGPVNITNLTLDGQASTIDSVGVYYQNSSGSVAHVVAFGQNLAAIWAENETTIPATVSVLNDTINGQLNGIVVTTQLSSLTVTLKNNISYNARASIYAYQTSGSVAFNEFDGGQYPLTIDIGSSLAVSQNTFTAGDDAILTGSSANTISYNHFGPGVSTGILLDGANNNTVANNTLRGTSSSAYANTSVGIDLGCTSASGNVIKSNLIENTLTGVANIGAGNTVAVNNFFNVDALETACN